MKFKNKRHIIVPSAIVVYTIVIAIYAGMKMYTPETKGSYYLVIGVNLALAVALYFILRKRENLRNDSKNNRENNRRNNRVE